MKDKYLREDIHWLRKWDSSVYKFTGIGLYEEMYNEIRNSKLGLKNYKISYNDIIASYDILDELVNVQNIYNNTLTNSRLSEIRNILNGIDHYQIDYILRLVTVELSDKIHNSSLLASYINKITMGLTLNNNIF